MVEIPLALEFNPSNNNIYVVNNEEDTVSVIDSSTNKVVKTISIGDGPNDIEYNPFNHNMYVPNISENTVSVIDSTTNKVIDTVDVGHAPTVSEYNPFNNNVYVVNDLSGDVSIIKAVGTPPTGGLKTIADLIKSIIQSPSDITNSIETANEIRDILTDDT